jgi:hypothetical protein
MRISERVIICLLSSALLPTVWPQDLPVDQNPRAPAQTAPASLYPQQTPERLQQLVAPIALYPDSLVAQILAASTFPEQVVEADRWIQAHPDLTGDDLGHAVDRQPWDPSVKALSAFPSVLGNMDKNLSWTSSLGDAYYNQQADVMDAVQAMRRRAEAAGNLKNTPQQTVESQGSTIVIQPTAPAIVYLPAYDPWLVYGDPILAWPGWYPYPGLWYDGPFLSFGIGYEIGFFSGFGWGWRHWDSDWDHRTVIYDNRRYYSESRTFYNRSNFDRGDAFNRGGGSRGESFNRPGAPAMPFGRDPRSARGYGEPRGQSGIRSGALSGSGFGGDVRGFSSRGSSSFGGPGGALRGGGFGGGARPGGGFGGGVSGGHGGGHR